MGIIQTDLGSTYLQSFNELKSTAKNLDDIAAWFHANLDAIDPNYKDSVDRVVVNMKYDKDVLSLFTALEPDKMQQLSVVLVRKEIERVNTPFMDALAAHPVIEAARCDHWHFPVVMSEWACLIAHLTYKYVAREYWRKDIYKYSDKVTSFVDMALEKHFPGCTTASLRALVDGGLLQDVKLETITEILFTARHRLAAQDKLPTNFTLSQ